MFPGIAGPRFVGPKIVKPGLHLGYPSVHIARKTVFVHSLVLAAFIGPRPTGHQAAHGNGSRDDNRLENLRWATPLENNNDKIAHGTLLVGARHPMARLSDAQVMEIRGRRAAGEAPRLIAKSFGVSAATVCEISNGKKWRHLPVARVPVTRAGGKLTFALAEEIRATTGPLRVAAAAYGVSRASISRIRRGEAWRSP